MVEPIDSTDSDSKHLKSLELLPSPMPDAIATFLQLLLVFFSPVT